MSISLPFTSQWLYELCVGRERPPFAGRRGVRGSSVVLRESPSSMGIICLLKSTRHLALYKTRTSCKFWGLGTTEPNYNVGGPGANFCGRPFVCIFIINKCLKCNTHNIIVCTDAISYIC